MNKSNVFSNETDVKCCVCGKSLFDEPNMSMINIIQNMDTKKIVSVKPCCKGKCDRKVSILQNDREISGWKDFTEFLNPYQYMNHLMSVMNSMNKGIGFENDEAFEDYKQLILNAYPCITRNMTDDEIRAAVLMNQMPF